MSAIANLVAFDGAATPVSHTLVGTSVSREKGRTEALYREQVAGVPVEAQVRAMLSLERLKSGIYKTEVRVVIPVMETVSNQNAAGYTAQPKVAYENTCISTGFFSSRSDVIGRRTCRVLANNIMNGLTTTLAAITTGPGPEVVDQLVAPT